MAKIAGTSRYAAPLQSDAHSEHGDEPVTQEDTDLVLRKAIRYMTSNGRSDSQELYDDRVNRIDMIILKGYHNQGYLYDHRLYRQLRSLVRDAQTKSSAEDESNLSDSDVSMEELYSPEALYREDESPDYTPAGRQAPRPASPTPRLPGTRRAEVIETQFLYGGPNNEVEEWHTDYPAALPFGETLFNQQWESMKIDYDLAESTRTLHSDKDYVVHTNVPYGAAEARFGTPAQYESGSRFRIPAKVWTKWDEVEESTMSKSALAKRVDEFNRGGDSKEQAANTYVPRIFLTQVSHEVLPASISLQAALGGQPALHNNNPHNPTPAREGGSTKGALYVNASYPTPPHLRTHRSMLLTKALKRFDGRRAALTKSGESAAPKESAPQPSVSRTSRSAKAGPLKKRKSVPPKNDAIAVVIPRSGPMTTRSRGQKRKISDVDYVPTPNLPEAPTKKAKKAAATPKPSKSAEKISAIKKPVTPAKKAATPAPQPQIKKAASVKKSSNEKILRVRKTSSEKPASDKKASSEKVGTVKKAPSKKESVAVKKAPISKKSVGVKKAAIPEKNVSPKKTTRTKTTPIGKEPKNEKKTANTKKAAAKRKGKEAGSVPEVLAKDVRAGTKSSLRMGTTRSGIKFK